MKSLPNVINAESTDVPTSSEVIIGTPDLTQIITSDKSYIPDQNETNHMCDHNVSITTEQRPTQNPPPAPANDDVMSQYTHETQHELSQSVNIDNSTGVTFSNSPQRVSTKPSPPILRSHTADPRIRNHTDV